MVLSGVCIIMITSSQITASIIKHSFSVASYTTISSNCFVRLTVVSLTFLTLFMTITSVMFLTPIMIVAVFVTTMTTVTGMSPAAVVFIVTLVSVMWRDITPLLVLYRIW